MSRLQRSSVSFRRQGSSGRIWDDPLRGLDLKGLSSTTPRAGGNAVVAPMHPDARILAGDPSPRVVSRSLIMRHGGGGGGFGGGSVGASSAAAAGGVIVESPDVAASPATTVVVRADGERHERPARRRRRISAAFCACKGHPPASHAQQ